MNKPTKRNITLFIITIILIVGMLSYCTLRVIKYIDSRNIEHYKELTQSVDIMPKLNELGNYEDYSFKYHKDSHFIFFMEQAYTLKVTYDDENYEKEKEALEDKYIYRSKKFTSYGENNKEPYFSIDSFEFKILSDAYESLGYPKDIIFVGTSDEENTIAYVYFTDTDLDYIDTSFEEFLRNSCGW